VPNSFVGGTAGRVVVNGVTVVGIKNWRLEQVSAEIPLPNFESEVDAGGRVWPDYIVGLSGATGTFEGYYDINVANPTDAILSVSGAYGATYILVLYFSKYSLWGFAVEAIITQLGAGTNVENQPAMFTANFRVAGVVPLSSVN
jgi:hypothetical protein